MSFLPMTEYESSSEEVKREYEDQIAKHGRITNMKRTLLHNIPAFKPAKAFLNAVKENK